MAVIETVEGRLTVPMPTVSRGVFDNHPFLQVIEAGQVVGLGRVRYRGRNPGSLGLEWKAEFADLASSVDPLGDSVV